MWHYAERPKVGPLIFCTHSESGQRLRDASTASTSSHKCKPHSAITGPFVCRTRASNQKTQSAPRPRGRGDCGPVWGLGRRGFVALFRQPANPSRTERSLDVKERFKVSVADAVVKRREAPVAGPPLGVRGRGLIRLTAGSGPAVCPRHGARSAARPSRPGSRTAANPPPP